MDTNSIEAYKTVNKDTRYAEILHAYEVKGPMTDREVCHFLGYGEALNKVRPRITELLNMEAAPLVKSGSIQDNTTGHPVRLVRRAWSTEVQLRFAM